jgi:hypothetical protein
VICGDVEGVARLQVHAKYVLRSVRFDGYNARQAVCVIDLRADGSALDELPDRDLTGRRADERPSTAGMR